MVESIVIPGNQTQIWKSYGFSCVLFTLLDDIEALQLQALNKFWYDIGTSRAQRSLRLKEPIFMLLSKRKSPNNCEIYCLTRNASRIFPVLRLKNFIGTTQFIQVKRSIFMFCPGQFSWDKPDLKKSYVKIEIHSLKSIKS